MGILMAASVAIIAITIRTSRRVNPSWVDIVFGLIFTAIPKVEHIDVKLIFYNFIKGSSWSSLLIFSHYNECLESAYQTQSFQIFESFEFRKNSSD